MDDLHNRLTLVIPTHNRPAFLRRLFHFLKQTHNESQIQIVDSSEPGSRLRNEEAVCEYSKSLRIAYRHIDAGMISKCRQAMEENLTTPFCVFCADDDFLMPEAVTNSLNFLEQSPDYSCVQGVMASLCTGKDNKCYALPCYSIDHENAVQRFRNLADNWYSTFYSVYRTPLLARAWQITDDNSDYERGRIFPEILLSQLSVVLGKVKYVPGLYCLREEHTLNESAVIPDITSMDQCVELYDQFRQVMSNELAKASNGTAAQAGAVVDSFYGHLRDGGKAFSKKKRTIGFRVQREIKRQTRRMIDILRRDQILQRRRLNIGDAMSRNDDCRLAFELMLKFPNGIEEDVAAVA